MLSSVKKKKIRGYFDYIFVSTNSAITEAFYIPYVVEDFVREGKNNESLLNIFGIDPQNKTEVAEAYHYLLKLTIKFSSKALKTLKNEKKRVINTLKQAISLVPKEAKSNKKSRK